ncbi:hypothetical protein HDU96_004070 [Phlyctochytrium bullatum]|nr:hypothetical protein HDU96_004070 [Phlyctochytrium bullatum]
MVHQPAWDYFELETILPELAPDIAKHLHPIEVPILASASRRCRALFHTPSNKHGLAIAGRHLLFWAACRNFPCPPEHSPYDGLFLPFLTKTYALAAFCVLGLSRRLLSLIHPDTLGGKRKEIIRPPRNPKPLCSLLTIAVRMRLVDAERSILKEIACVWDYLPLIQTILSTLPNPRDQLVELVRFCCFYNSVHILSYLFDHPLHGRVTKQHCKQNRIGQFFLHAAAERGSEAVAKMLLKNGSAVEARLDLGAPSNVNGFTPLHIASRNGYIQIVRHILFHGANTESQDLDGKTALELAIEQKDDETASLLVSHGAVATLAHPPFFYTPLHKACCWNMQSTVKAMLDSGRVDVNALNSRLQTPLHHAAFIGSLEIVSLLVAHGAAVHVTDQFGYTPLYILAKEVPNPARAIRKLLAGGACLGIPGPMGRTAFHLLCMHAKDSREVAELFNLSGWDMNLEDSTGDTPLMALAKSDSDKPCIGAALIAAGANVKVKERTMQRTPLHWAIEKGHFRLALVLLKNGADALSRDGTWKLPWQLHPLSWSIVVADVVVGVAEFATLVETFLQQYPPCERPAALAWVLSQGKRPDSIQIVQYLLSMLYTMPRIQQLSMALRNFADIHEAILQRNDQVLKLLLDAGADVNQCHQSAARNLQGVTPLFLAIRKGTPWSIWALMEYGANLELRGPDGCTALLTAMAAQNTEAVRLILQRGANTAATEWSSRGFTAMHLACLNRMPETVVMLTKARADVDAFDGEGSTPLHLAITLAPEMVMVLLSNGANPNAVGWKGLTPLHLAALQHRKPSFLDVWRLLLDKGAFPHAVTPDGRTPLHILCQLEDDGAHIAGLIGSGIWGVDVNRCDASGNTPLLYVASCRVDKPVAGQALIASGADLHAIHAVLKESPLQRAATGGNFNLLRVLLLAGSNPLSILPDNANFPALFEALMDILAEHERVMLVQQTANWACQTGHVCALRCLSSHPEYADIMLSAVHSRIGSKALEELLSMAVGLRDITVLELLVNLVGPILLQAAINANQLDILAWLLDRGVRAEYVTTEGRTALLTALEKGLEDVAMALIVSGADPMARDLATGATPLHVACSCGFVGAARMLLEAGADPNACNVRGETPLHVTPRSHVQMICALLAAGANPTTVYVTEELHVKLNSRV